MSTNTKLSSLTITDAAELLRTKEISPVELTRVCLEQIERLNPILNAFITITKESAFSDAQAAENEIQRGDWRGPLHGIPIGLKDLIDTAGIKTTCGSALFASRMPTRDAFIVEALKRAGAVIVGKQNMQEFAYGGTSAASYFGPVRNPWDPDRIAGGSSGGSAAAVAVGMCLGAIGSDTGGSVRQPAAFCGVVGLKPTYGRVSTRGTFPLSWSLDHIGPICRNVSDVTLMLEAIAGYDPLDATSVDLPTERYSDGLAHKTAFRIGVVRRYFEDLDPEVETAVNEAIKLIGENSIEVRDVDLPDAPTTVIGPEAYALHARSLAEAPQQYQRWTRERLDQAANVSTIDYVEGRRKLEQVRRSAKDVFSTVELLVTPTTPVPPITLKEAMEMGQPPSPGEVWLRNTRPFNAFGLPAISIPCGFTSIGLPIGLQIAGPHFAEARVLSLAYAYEQVTDWHKRRPILLS